MLSHVCFRWHLWFHGFFFLDWLLESMFHLSGFSKIQGHQLEVYQVCSETSWHLRKCLKLWFIMVDAENLVRKCLGIDWASKSSRRLGGDYFKSNFCLESPLSFAVFTLSGWWFQILFIFTPTWERIQFDEHIFHMGWFNHHLVIDSLRKGQDRLWNIILFFLILTLI